MFRKGSAVRVIDYAYGWNDCDFVVEAYDAETDTYTVRERVEEHSWPDVPAKYVVDAKGMPMKTSFNIISEWEGDHDMLGVGHVWAGSVPSALEMHQAAMERARPGRNFKIIAVLPSRVYDQLPEGAFGKVRWDYGKKVDQIS